jgi:hypothetical protein
MPHVNAVSVGESPDGPPPRPSRSWTDPSPVHVSTQATAKPAGWCGRRTRRPRTARHRASGARGDPVDRRVGRLDPWANREGRVRARTRPGDQPCRARDTAQPANGPCRGTVVRRTCRSARSDERRPPGRAHGPTVSRPFVRSAVSCRTGGRNSDRTRERAPSPTTRGRGVRRPDEDRGQVRLVLVVSIGRRPPSTRYEHGSCLTD